MNSHYCQSLHSSTRTAWLVKGQCQSNVLSPPLQEVKPLMNREAVRSGQDSHSSTMLTLNNHNFFFKLSLTVTLKISFFPWKSKQPSGCAYQWTVAVIDGHSACSVRLAICRIHKKRCWGNYVCHDILESKNQQASEWLTAVVCRCHQTSCPWR